MARHAAPGVVAGGITGFNSSRGDMTKPDEMVKNSTGMSDDNDSNAYRGIKDTNKICN